MFTKAPTDLKKQLFQPEYKKFLKELTLILFSEHSAENILFLASVRDFRNDPTIDKMDLIKSSFIFNGSVNISDSNKQKADRITTEELNKRAYYLLMEKENVIRKAEPLKFITTLYNFDPPTRNRSSAISIVKKPNPAAFEAAETEIYSLIKRDTMTRLEKKFNSISNIFSKKPKTGKLDYDAFKAYLLLMQNCKMLVPVVFNEIKESDFSEITKIATRPTVSGDENIYTENELGW